VKGRCALAAGLLRAAGAVAAGGLLPAAGAVAAGGLLPAACAGTGGDPLRGAHPYVLPWRETVRLFHCRFRSDRPVGVALPADAGEAERRALEAALAAWRRAGLGLELVEVPAGEAEIEIALRAEPPRRDDGRTGSGRTVADCRVDPVSGRAELVAARIEIARATSGDWRGRRHVLGPDALAGAALHELGHALGFQGHAPREEPMAASASTQRRLGARALRGERVGSPALRALYAGRGPAPRVVPVSRWRTEPVDRLARVAAERGLAGPFARVGDHTAQVFFRDGSGGELGVAIPNLAETLRDPSLVLAVPDARARAALAPGGGTP
jgi:hypothetical protein